MSKATLINLTQHNTKKESASFWKRLKKDYIINKYVYWIIAPVVIYYLIFAYIPMFGQIIAFENYKPAKGVFGSSWVGLKNFIQFFESPFAYRIIRNTIIISFTEIIFGFPMPILLALMLNELRGSIYRRLCQTITYMPHFISLVVTCGIIISFTNSKGIVTMILAQFGIEPTNMLSNAKYYIPIYVISGIWKNIGWGSIIYLATLSNIDQSLYESASIDGAGRMRKIIHITMPALVPIIAIQLILRVGQIMSQGAEKTILLYSPVIYDVSDTIASYVYRIGITEQNYSLASAVGVFNSVINLSLVIFANWFSAHYVKESLW